MRNNETVQALNDAFRRSSSGGRVFLTRGVAARADVQAIIDRVKGFDDFDDGNDPYGEHDFGAFDQNGDKIFWKIDYYDRQLTHGSPDPSDPAVTTRLLTIMLASEY